MVNKRLQTAIDLALQQPDEQQEIIAEMIERILLPPQRAPKLSSQLETLLQQVMRDRQATLKYLEDK